MRSVDPIPYFFQKQPAMDVQVKNKFQSKFWWVKPYICVMKVLLDIRDNKAQSLLDVLNGLPYVKTKTLSNYEADALEQVKIAVEELKLVKQGKLKARDAKDLLNELWD